jgi:hypothetical protein
MAKNTETKATGALKTVASVANKTSKTQPDAQAKSTAGWNNAPTAHCAKK